MTAIGAAVPVASRLQGLTKEYPARLVASEVVATVAGLSLGAFPAHEVQLRGLSTPLAIRAIDGACEWLNGAGRAIVAVARRLAVV